MDFTDKQYQIEHDCFHRSPDWELRNIKRALGSMSWLNTPEQSARLAAVTDILKQRQKVGK